MKVDSVGNPVSEGTFGLMDGYSAKVVRTFANPISDNEEAQQTIFDGGYIVDLGASGGEIPVDPSRFTATNDGDHVFAQDGQLVGEGDKIELTSWPSDLKAYKDKGVTVKSLYPIGTLRRRVCLSVEEAEGNAPDGHFAVTWGNVKRVIEKANQKKETKYRNLKGSDDNSFLQKYDYIRFLDDNNKPAEGFIAKMEDHSGYNGRVWIAKSDTGLRLGMDYWFRTSKVTEVFPHKEGPWPTPVGFVRKGDIVKTRGTKYAATFDVKGAGFKEDKKQDGLTILPGTVTEFNEAHAKDISAWWANHVIEITPSGFDFDDLQIGDEIVFLADNETEVTGTITLLDKEEYRGRWDGVVEITASDDTNECPIGESYWFRSWKVLSVRRDGQEITASNSSESSPFTPTGESENMAQAASTGKSATELKLNTLNKATSNKAAGKVDVVHEGTQIILPERGPASTTKGAITELQRRLEQEEMDVNIMELIDGYPLDAAVSFIRALEHLFGWVNAMPTPGFFGPTPPTMVGVTIDAEGNTVQIPWGQIQIPGVTGKLATGIQLQDGSPIFCIQGTIKQKDKRVVNEIAKFTRDWLKENSIYKGKAFKVRFPEVGKAWSPLDHQPKFIQTANVRPEELIFSADVEKRIRVNVWTPITANGAVRNARVPLKRGVLLFGRYGVGKTLLATVTAQLAVKNGTTFIDLEDSRQLPQAIRFARTFGGMVVIFAEDIDRCDENGTRTDAFNEILNTVDGLTSKTDEILVVYTTNHIERISKAMLRQGRIDKVIEIKEPNAEAACKLIRLYARHMLAPSENIGEIGEMIAEQKMIPAAIREIVEQSKLAAIERGDVTHITAEDLRLTVEDTKAHNELLKETPVDDRSELEKLGDALGRNVGRELRTMLDSHYSVYNTNTDTEGDTASEELETEITEAVQQKTSRRRKSA